MKSPVARSTWQAEGRQHDLLIKSLDGMMTPEEEAELMELLASSAEARAELRHLEHLRALAFETRRDSFSYGFSNRVMRRILQDERISGFEGYVQDLLWSFRRVTITAGIIALTMAAYMFAATGTASSLTSSLNASSRPASASAAIDLMEIP